MSISGAKKKLMILLNMVEKGQQAIQMRSQTEIVNFKS